MKERAPTWLPKSRTLPVRYDMHDENYLGLLQMAYGLLRYSQFKIINLNNIIKLLYINLVTHLVLVDCHATFPASGAVT